MRLLLFDFLIKDHADTPGVIQVDGPVCQLFPGNDLLSAVEVFHFIRSIKFDFLQGKCPDFFRILFPAEENSHALVDRFIPALIRDPDILRCVVFSGISQ